MYINLISLITGMLQIAFVVSVSNFLHYIVKTFHRFAIRFRRFVGKGSPRNPRTLAPCEKCRSILSYRIGVSFLLVPLPYFRLTEIIGTKTSTAVDENEKHISDRYHKKPLNPQRFYFQNYISGQVLIEI